MNKNLLHPFPYALCLAVALAGLSSSPHAFAGRKSEQATLNFVDAEVDTVIRALGKVSGHNYLIDPRVKGKLNVISERPVSRDVFQDMILSALRLQGFAAVDKKGYTLILPEADARQHTGNLTAGTNTQLKGGRLGTRVYTLRHEQPNQVLQAIRPLVSNANAASAQSSGNNVLVTDYVENLDRIGAIIESIDQPQGGEPVFIQLEHASAADLAQTLPRILAETTPSATGATSASGTSIWADPRSNRLIVRADSPARVARIRSLARSLDTAGLPGGQVHVVPLRNADASRLATILRLLIGAETSSTTTSVAPPQQTSPTSAGGSPTGTGGAVQSGAFPLPGGGSIQADPTTNSLIIAAPEALYRNLRGVIEQLDVRRAQIYVEALIAEIDVQKLEEFGFQWMGLNGVNKTGAQVIGGTSFGSASGGTNILGLAQNPLGLTNARGLNLGVVRGSVTVAGQTVLNLGALAHALESDGNSHILSTPTLLTLDNEEAKIVIGENVPFITGQYAQTGATVTATPFQTIERKDVGLTLRVRPLITESGTVRMQIFQEVSSVQQGTLTNAAGPSTNKRSIESTVLVDDGSIVALGGLIQEQVDQNAEKVPLLGDLPLLGNLMRYDSRQRKRTSLTIFLRPVILRDGLAQSRLSISRYDEVLREQKSKAVPGHWLLPDLPTPQLPDRAPAGAGK